MEQRKLEFEARVYQAFFRDSNIGFWHAYFPQPLDTQLSEDTQIDRLFAEPLIDFCSESFSPECMASPHRRSFSKHPPSLCQQRRPQEH